MKKLLILLIAGSALLPETGVAAQTASARMWCWSVRFHQGDGPSDLYTLDLTTLNSGVNGELAPLFGDYSHWSFFDFNDLIFDETITGILNMDTPEFADANGDGFDDFFDVTQGVSGSGSGIFAFDFEGVTRSLSASWSRGAGNASGTCVITLQGYGSFTHTFDLLEYTGPLSYTPGSNIVSGGVLLTNTANPSETFTGPVSFVKAVSDRFNRLRLQSGEWTNAIGETLRFDPNDYFRDAEWPTNYYGYFDFDDDGDLDTFQPYSTWYLSIDDLNDADSDGIPDFSDDLFRRPELSLHRDATNILMTVSGDVGRTYEIQGLTRLGSANWSHVAFLSLTNDPQTVSLGIPVESTRFWRVIATMP